MPTKTTLDDAIRIWTRYINQPIEMVHLITTGNLVEGTSKPVAALDFHPGTPLLFTFASGCVVLTCEPDAIVASREVEENFDLDSLFLRDPVMYDQECFIARQPIWRFLNGPFGDCFHSQSGMLIDKLELIARLDSEDNQHLAAVIIFFHDAVRFGISAAHESHFYLCYNEHCDQLSKEARGSANHVVVTVARQNALPRSPDSLLWMVE